MHLVGECSGGRCSSNVLRSQGESVVDEVQSARAGDTQTATFDNPDIERLYFTSWIYDLRAFAKIDLCGLTRFKIKYGSELGSCLLMQFKLAKDRCQHSVIR